MNTSSEDKLASNDPTPREISSEEKQHNLVFIAELQALQGHLDGAWSLGRNTLLRAFTSITEYGNASHACDVYAGCIGADMRTMASAIKQATLRCYGFNITQDSDTGKCSVKKDHAFVAKVTKDDPDAFTKCIAVLHQEHKRGDPNPLREFIPAKKQGSKGKGGTKNKPVATSEVESVMLAFGAQLTALAASEHTNKTLLAELIAEFKGVGVKLDEEAKRVNALIASSTAANGMRRVS